MSDSEFDRRSQLSFLQAEGLIPLPAWEPPRTVTKKFRATAYEIICRSVHYEDDFSYGAEPSSAAKYLWLNYFGEFHDAMPVLPSQFSQILKRYIAKDEMLLDLLEWCTRHKILNYASFEQIKLLLREERISHRFIGDYGSPNVTLMPISDDLEEAENEKHYSSLELYPKAREHFVESAKQLSVGNFRGSIAESINGVESVLKTVTGEGKAPFGTALKVLEKQAQLHPSLKKALGMLYGSTNGPDGKRHAMTDDAVEVGENEAMFMFSACIAFAAWVKRSAV